MNLLPKITVFIIIIASLLFFLAKSIDLTKSVELIKNFPVALLILLAGISLLLSFLKAVRFHIMLKPTIDISIAQSLKIYFAGQCLSPLPGGAAARALMIRQETGDNYVKASGPLVAVSFMEILSALVITIIGSMHYNILRFPAALASLLIVFVGYILLNHKILHFLIGKTRHVPFLRNHSQKLVKSLNYVKESIVNKDHKPNRYFINSLLLGIVSTVLGGVMIALIAKELGFNIDLFRSTFIFTSSLVIATFTGILPGGLGTTEGGLTGILLVSGINLQGAIAIVLLFRILTLLLYFFVGLFVLLIFYSKLLVKANE